MVGTTVEEEVRARVEEIEQGATEVQTVDREKLAISLEKEMLEAAQALEFERAALLRDRIARLRGEQPDPDTPSSPPRRRRRRH